MSHRTCAPIRQNPRQRHVLLFEPGNHPVIEQIGGNQRILAVVEFDEGDIAVSVDDDLLVDASGAFDLPNIVGILRAEIAWMFGPDFAFSLDPFGGTSSVVRFHRELL